VEMMVSIPLMVVVVAQGGVGGRNGDGVGFLWRRKKEAEAEEENLQRGEGGRLVFWLNLDPILSSLRPSNPPLFIGSRRGQSCLQWRKISALDSDGNDPNRWLKLGMVHCQIVKSAAAGCLSFPLWGGSTSVYLPVSRERPYPDVEGCLMISFVQVFANLVDAGYIKCSFKVGNQTSLFRKKMRKIMNSAEFCFWPKFIAVLHLSIAINGTPN